MPPTIRRHLGTESTNPLQPGAPRTFSVKNFGCRTTQADGAGIAADLMARGLQREVDPARADVVVLNTCTVTSQADRDARQTIRRIHRENPDASILVTGCYAQHQPEQLAAMEGVRWVVGNSHKHVVGDIVAPRLVRISGAPAAKLSYHSQISAVGTLVSDFARDAAFEPLPSGTADDRSRPNLKVQEGCSSRCTFCIIPSMRGRSRSANAPSVVQAARTLQAEYPEVVLTGINLGRWGRDLPGRPRFVSLLESLLAETEVRRFRISSVEPMDWRESLLRLVSESPRIAQHVHVPLQSGSDTILRAMRRRYRARHYATRVQLARRLMPMAAIGADVMVGFPGESEADFEATRSFVDAMPFTYLHVFSYSIRGGTEAAHFANQVPKVEKRRRSRVLRELAASKNLKFRQQCKGARFSAVTVSSSPNGTRVVTDNYIDLDLPGAHIEPRTLVDVEIESVTEARTTGRALE